MPIRRWRRDGLARVTGLPRRFTPTLPGGVTPPIGTLPPGGITPTLPALPPGVTPTVPGGVYCPLNVASGRHHAANPAA